ncbi:MAG: nitrogenase molybdenum-iron protein alpha chain, partial [Deltaproteobacteria bacterium CG_4_9_14_3_um_filter_44_9]
PDTPCTNLMELELVYGAEKKLRRGIVETYERYRPALIVVVPTCPSDMIGDDLAAAVRQAKKEVGCEVVYSTGELIKGRP